MIQDTDKVVIKNRFSGTVAYNVPDFQVSRMFMPGEIKRMITVGEIRALEGTPGGHALLEDYLQIQEPKELIYELFPNLEPEYNYSEEEVIAIIQDKSVDEFKDCIDFAPQGVIEMIKTLAVSLPMTNADKREYLLKKTGLDVTKAIKNNQAAKEAKTTKVEPMSRQNRRVKEENIIVE